MEVATREYLKRRFEDYYRSERIPEPSHVTEREFGYIPWDDDTRMIRHRSVIQMDGFQDYFATKRPRHVYMSAARFDNPSASTMEEKGRNATTLVFDIDGDHLPGVDPDTIAYPDMLERGREEVLKLIELLESDFGFSDFDVFFSGGRGYHVHVYDDGVEALSKDARQDMIEYLSTETVVLDDLLTDDAIGDLHWTSRASSSKSKQLIKDGWGDRIRDAVLEDLERIESLNQSDAVAEFRDIDGIGEKTAKGLVDFIDTDNPKIQSGVIDAHDGFSNYVELVAHRVFLEQAAHVDEPVTTDLNRLMRLPGSLHGGTSLKVTEIPRGNLTEFNPLTDAIPDFFTGESVDVSMNSAVEIDVGGVSVDADAGDEYEFTEPVAMFLMSRGDAEYVAD